MGPGSAQMPERVTVSAAGWHPFVPSVQKVPEYPAFAVETGTPGRRRVPMHPAGAPPSTIPKWLRYRTFGAIGVVVPFQLGCLFSLNLGRRVDHCRY